MASSNVSMPADLQGIYSLTLQNRAILPSAVKNVLEELAARRAAAATFAEQISAANAQLAAVNAELAAVKAAIAPAAEAPAPAESTGTASNA